LYYNAIRRLTMKREQLDNVEDVKQEIIVEIRNLSRLFAKMPKVDAVDDARSSFLRLSALIDKTLNLRLVERALEARPPR